MNNEHKIRPPSPTKLRQSTNLPIYQSTNKKEGIRTWQRWTPEY